MLLTLLCIGCRQADDASPPAAGADAAPQKITTTTGIEMVLLPGGEFTMGDDRGEADEQPAHRVELSSFYIDAREVTQEAYQKLMGTNPAKFKGPDRPIERVSWLAAIQFCNMRSLREGFKPCYNAETQKCDFTADGYRLPSEAEWEYACRAGTTTAWSFGDGADRIGKHAWLKDNADKSTHPVAEKGPNPWGIYDMHGNVAEWCHDFHRAGYGGAPDATVVKDPHGPDEGDERILRGGSWSSTADACRSAARASQPPVFADVCFGIEAYGFRCVRRAP